ncbi:MAG: ROK family protein [Mediterraneibacter gnavus]
MCACRKYFGSAQDKDDFLYLTVSTGIGGALYIEGNLYYGSHRACR